MKLEGKVAIVTGAVRGIGRSITLGLAREGALVVACDVRGGEDAESLLREIKEANGQARFVEADVSKLDGHERLIDAAQDNFGSLDVLVNNAGIEIRQSFLQATLEAWEQTININLRGAFFLAQKAARVMVKQGGGKIINVTSIHDTVALQNASVYAITKGGMMMMTRSLALELAEHNINVNAIAPGAILTDMNREVLSNEVYLQRVLEKIPIGRVGSTEDIVGAAIYLASSDSDYMTGNTLYVDGGILLQ